MLSFWRIIQTSFQVFQIVFFFLGNMWLYQAVRTKGQMGKEVGEERGGGWMNLARDDPELDGEMQHE